MKRKIPALNKTVLLVLTFLTFSSEAVYASDHHKSKIEDHDSSAVTSVPRPLPLTDWSKHLNMTFDPEGGKGSQVMHFSSNKFRKYQDDPGATDFVKTYCKEAKHLDTDADTLRFASDRVTIPHGAYLEMGTGSGRTTNFIAALNPKQIIHTFDSFEGLGEDWEKGSRTIEKGSFAFKDSNYVPPVLNNVRIYKGWFKDVLPTFKQYILKDQPIAFLNMDADIYSASKDVFEALGDNIVPGTVIHFDEFYNYPHYKEGEYKAFQEFIEARKFSFEVIGFNAVHEQVVVKIK